MKSLEELRRLNDEAAAKELAELRADTIKGLRYVFRLGNENAIAGLTGAYAVQNLLEEAGVLGPLFDLWADRKKGG